MADSSSAIFGSITTFATSAAFTAASASLYAILDQLWAKISGRILSDFVVGPLQRPFGELNLHTEHAHFKFRNAFFDLLAQPLISL